MTLKTPPSGTNAQTMVPMYDVLEESLVSQGGELLKQSMLARIAVLEQSLRNEIHSGLSRESYETCESLIDALRAARGVLRKLVVAVPLSGGLPTPASSSKSSVTTTPST